MGLMILFASLAALVSLSLGLAAVTLRGLLALLGPGRSAATPLANW